MAKNDLSNDELSLADMWLSELCEKHGCNAAQLHSCDGDFSEVVRELYELSIKAERFDLALSVANDGMYDWNVQTNDIFFDERYYTMAGYEPYEFPGTFDEWVARVHEARRALRQVRAVRGGLRQRH